MARFGQREEISALAALRRRAIEQRQALEDSGQAYQELRAKLDNQKDNG